MSVRELVRNKKYQIEIPLSYNGNKKNRHFETFYGGKKDALLREAKLKMQLKDGSFVPKNNLTIQDLSEEYLNYKKLDTCAHKRGYSLRSFGRPFRRAGFNPTPRGGNKVG